MYYRCRRLKAVEHQRIGSYSHQESFHSMHLLKCVHYECLKVAKSYVVLLCSVEAICMQSQHAVFWRLYTRLDAEVGL
jgi:hypothetical protein